MWSLRTAARRVTSKTSVLRSSNVGACCTDLDLLNNNIDEKQYSTSHPISVIHCPERTSATRPFPSCTISIHGRNLSSHVDTKSSNKETEELEGFSDLDTDAEEKDIEHELASESDDVSADEEELVTKKMVYKSHRSPFFEVILNSPRHTLDEYLEKWVMEGKQIKKEEVLAAAMQLRRKKLFGKALQFMKWLEKSEHYKFSDVEYSSLLDLHAKAYGLNQAEKFLEEIPQSMQTEHVYRSLLSCCVSVTNVLKAEKIFNKMRDLNFPLTAYACNQLLLLYKRVDKKKIADVLLMMEKEELKPTLFTYKVLIDTKGLVGDIPAMEKLLTTMEEDGIEPNEYIKHMVAKHYIKAGLTENAEEIAKEMEGGDLNIQSVDARKLLLNLYAELGRSDDVDRVWKACRANPTLSEAIAVMWAWGKLGKLEDAEKVFDQMFKRFSNVSYKCYNCILSIYADKKMLDKAKNLVKRMSDDGIVIGPMALDMLVKLYVEKGDVEKADGMLQNWVQKYQKIQMKPMFNSYMNLLEAYAKKGDYHNAEKMLFLMKQMGYFGRLRMYELVLSAYVNAKVPAYGFRDRLRADNIFPRQGLTSQLLAVDPFKKAPVTEVLE